QVHVKAFAQVFHGHHRALDVPAGASGTDAGLPLRLTRLGGLPQREVAGVIFFVFIQVNAGAVFHALEVFFRELAIRGKLGNTEVIGAVFATVGVALLDQGGDKIRHLTDVIGGSR